MDRQEHLKEELEKSLIGGLEPRTVNIVDYDPAWVNRFEEERDRLRAALGETARMIEHIGSTSVPGLAAKPVVDILLTVGDVDDESGYRSAIEALGYELRVREPGHRAFRTPARDVNLHVWPTDDPAVDSYLRFRDRLRNAPEDRALYERVKRELATRDWRDVNYYAEAKSEVVAEILERAE